jgi:hypothetical protein
MRDQSLLRFLRADDCFAITALRMEREMRLRLMKIKKRCAVSCYIFLLLISAVWAQRQPSQPSTGYGAKDYLYGEVLQSAHGDGGASFMLYVPNKAGNGESLSDCLDILISSPAQNILPFQRSSHQIRKLIRCAGKNGTADCSKISRQCLAGDDLRDRQRFP